MYYKKENQSSYPSNWQFATQCVTGFIDKKRKCNWVSNQTNNHASPAPHIVLYCSAYDYPICFNGQRFFNLINWPKTMHFWGHDNNSFSFTHKVYILCFHSGSKNEILLFILHLNLESNNLYICQWKNLKYFCQKNILLWFIVQNHGSRFWKYVRLVFYNFEEIE